jgi:hypothetical protein
MEKTLDRPYIGAELGVSAKETNCPKAPNESYNESGKYNTEDEEEHVMITRLLRDLFPRRGRGHQIAR